MIPVLYGKDEQQFRTYGLGELSEFLDTPEVERERNGNYAFYMKYESDGEFADVLEEGMKIKSDAGPRTEWQTFEINRINRDSQGFIEIFANHISMRTKKDAIRPRVSGRGMNGQQLLQLWRNNLVGGGDWDVWSDITTTVSVDWSIEDFDNAREVLGGREGSILDRIGGEYEFDNQTIRLWRSMGRTAPTALEYGRNIKSVVKENQEDNIYTSIYPFATYSPEGSDSVEVVSIPEYFIDSNYIDMYDHRKVQVVDFTTEFDNENPPTASALRTLAQNYIEANEVGSPWENITVEYQDLSKTLDYADYQIMEEVELNDIVPIEYPKFNIFNNNAKVIVTVYDPVKEEYKRIELGVIRQRLASALNSGTNGRLSRLERELEQQHVYILNSRGNRIWYSTPPEDREHNIGDTWFEQNGQYTRLRVWDGNQWIVQIDTEDIDVVAQQVEEALEEARDAKAQVERERDERRADIQAESERLSSEWNERIEENEQIVEGVRHSTEELMNDFDRALTQENFTSIEDLTTTLNSRSLEAIELAQEADGHAIEALDIANGFGTRITDVESTVDGQVTSINTAIETAERVERTISEVTDDVDGLSSRFVSIEADIEGITNTVSDYDGRISRTEQRADGLYDVVHDPNTGLLTEVGQIAEGWQVTAQRIDDMNEDMATQADITVLHNAIDLAVEEGDVIGRLNIQAGHTLIQNGEILMDADTVRFTGSAFIPSAAIEEVSANKIIGNDGQFNTLRSRFLTSNLIESDHLNVTTAMIDRFFANSALIERLTSQQAFINDIQAIEISADKITAGTLNAANVNLINVNAQSIAGNEANLISAMFNGTHSQLLLTGSSVGMMRLNDNTGYAFEVTNSEARFDLPMNMYAPLSMRTRPLYFGNDRNDQYIQSEGNTLQFRSGLSSNNVQMSIAPGAVNVYATTQMHGNLAMNLNQIFYSSQAAIRSQGNTLQFRIDATTLMSVGDNNINMWRQLNMNGHTITNSPSLSDERLKEFDWESDEDSLSIVRSWKLGRYRFNKKAEQEFGLIGQNEFGLSAQNTPDLMTYTADTDIYGVNHLKWTARNSHAIQQLAEEHENTLKVASHAYLLAEQHEDELACYKKKIEELEKKVKRLEGAA